MLDELLKLFLNIWSFSFKSETNKWRSPWRQRRSNLLLLLLLPSFAAAIRRPGSLSSTICGVFPADAHSCPAHVDSRTAHAHPRVHKSVCLRLSFVSQPFGRVEILVVLGGFQLSCSSRPSLSSITAEWPGDLQSVAMTTATSRWS